jgi:2-aminoadipate transaminase
MHLARWATETKPSFIREILKVTALPDVISFAGGLPAPELFPVAELSAALAAALTDAGKQVLQYSISEGDPELRARLAERLAARGIPAGPDDILITNGSQHGLDLIAKALVEPGDAVLVENPTYLGALQAFRPYRPDLIAVPSDEEGMLPDGLAAAIARKHPKLVYVMPTFQNPRGTSMGGQRRAELAAVCRAAEVALVEDDPYGELRYRGEPLPGLRHYWDQAIYLGTFSKTMAPGLRLGWIVAPPALMPALKLGVQATCLNVGALVQRAAATVLSGPGYGQHLDELRAAYGERNACMQEALAAHFPPGTTWSQPDGGLFLWVTLPDGIRAFDLVAAALAERVAFVPGEPFFVDGGGEFSMRLNFSNATPAQIREGVARLGRAVAGFRGRNQAGSPA